MFPVNDIGIIFIPAYGTCVLQVIVGWQLCICALLSCTSILKLLMSIFSSLHVHIFFIGGYTEFLVTLRVTWPIFHPPPSVSGSSLPSVFLVPSSMSDDVIVTTKRVYEEIMEKAGKCNLHLFVCLFVCLESTWMFKKGKITLWLTGTAQTRSTPSSNQNTSSLPINPFSRGGNKWSDWLVASQSKYVNRYC